MKNITAIMICSWLILAGQCAAQTGRFQTWQGQTYDLETYERGSTNRFGQFVRCGCNMCKHLYGLKDNYHSISNNAESFTTVTTIEQDFASAAQAPSTEEIQKSSVLLADFGPEDIVGEYGCGVADFCIRSIEAGAKRAYGFEIEPELVLKARLNVASAVVKGRIKAGSVIIVQKDVKELDPSKYGITVAYAYLYSELLDELSAAGKFSTIERLITPFHTVTGLASAEHETTSGDKIYLYVKGVTPPPPRFTFTPAKEVPLPPLPGSRLPASPASPPRVAPLWSVADFRVEMETRHSGCHHCTRWNNNEQRKILCSVEKKIVNGAIPNFRLKIQFPKDSGAWKYIQFDAEKVVGWYGYTSAEIINAEIQRQISAWNRSNK